MERIGLGCMSRGVYDYGKEEGGGMGLNGMGEEMGDGYEGEVIVWCLWEEDGEVYGKVLCW